MKIHSSTKATVWVIENGKIHPRSDKLATEEPLEIRLVAGDARRTVAVTMRSPGNDFELAAGFLYSEGIISSREDIRRITHCVDREVEIENRYNIVNVELASEMLPDLRSLERYFYTTSACGVCGKTSIEALRQSVQLSQKPGFSEKPGFLTPIEVTAEVIYSLPAKLRSQQRVFASTGGLHAAALFDTQGQLLALREDVGRHNAVDKLVGWALLSGQMPMENNIVMVSGRSSFEIVQKCLVAGVPIICAVSAPSSLAVALAEEFGITLVGFLRGERFNVYSGLGRILVI